MATIKKSAVAKAKDLKELRNLAAKAKVKFLGLKKADLIDALNKVATDDIKPVKVKKVKGLKKEAEAKPAKVKKEKAPAVKKERVLVSDKDMKAIDKYDTKKAKVITLRELGYSIHAIGEAVDLHPTNVSRYIREAGLSTSKVTVPEERKNRIKATIASKKPDAAPAKVKAVAVKDKKADAKPAVKKEKAVAKK